MEEFKKLPSIDFGESVKTVMTNLLNFKGRARRSELWWYCMLYAIVSFVINLTLNGFPIMSAILGFVLNFTLWSVTVRRLHDRGHSGWWVAASVIASIATQAYLIQSGYYEIMTSVNPNPEEAFAVLRGGEFLALILISVVINITIFVFCVLDGKPGTNKYGASTKYIDKETYIGNVAKTCTPTDAQH